MNVRASQRVYRAPYVYLAQSAERSRLVRIGHTLRPGYELHRMQKRYSSPVQWLCGVRAYAVLAPILWARFSYCSAGGGQWFHPDRHLLHFAERVSARNPEELLAVDVLLAIFSSVFPDAPYVGIAQYRLSETYLLRARYKYLPDNARLGK